MLHVWRYDEERDAGRRKRWKDRGETEVDEEFGNDNEEEEKNRVNPQPTGYSCKRSSCFKRNDNSARTAGDWTVVYVCGVY